MRAPAARGIRTGELSRYRTHTCGELTADDVGATVRLGGFLGARRDHGHLQFLHLRDFYGVTQVVVEPAALPPQVREGLARLQLESVLSVSGEVRLRPDGQQNPGLSTGEIEVVAREIDVLSAADEPPPFTIEKGVEPNEELRLRYRYLDLRRARMREMLVQRARLAEVIRKHFVAHGFLEVHTPVLTNSSPEGARDFLIPSRLHPGRFYALPQAPQQWKQLLVASGVDRYFQIAPCFRDEPARADRSPGEFYQLDVEMAFVEQEDVLTEMETLFVAITRDMSSRRIVTPFTRLRYAEALDRFGSDKPDLRFGLELRTLTDAFASSSVTFLREAVARGEAVRCLPIEGGAPHFSRRAVEELRGLARESGVGGLASLSWEDGELRGSLAGPIDRAEADRLAELIGAADGTLALLCAGPRDRIDIALSAIRLEVANRLGLRDPEVLHFAWVTDFPMYERDEETGALEFSHNPFSMPKGGLEALDTLDPLEVTGLQYDIVCNGFEVGSGAIRNSEPETVYRAFEIAGYPRSVVDEQFGHMVDAFSRGCPPHGGIAPGFERFLMLFLDETSLREVVPFPKNQKCEDLLVGAPSFVDEEQLRELWIQLDLPAAAVDQRAS